MTNVLVIGDSHVRRMAEFRHILQAKLHHNRIRVNFVHRGGAHLSFAESEVKKAYGYDIVLIMVGGNDLDRGATIPYFEASYRRIETAARERGITQIIITSVWPRHNGLFNHRATLLTQHLWTLFQYNQLVTFWQWDYRQSFMTYDGVHLMLRGYRKAISYLLAPILWAVKHKILRYLLN